MIPRYTVYVVYGPKGAVKIGYAADPDDRLSQLQTGSPATLAMYHVVEMLTKPEALRVERKAHEALKAKRIRGEWFKASLDEAIGAVWQQINSRIYAARILVRFGQDTMDAFQASRLDIDNGSALQQGTP